MNIRCHTECAPLRQVGKTAMMLAAEAGRDDAVKALLELNADIEATDNVGRHAYT